MTDSKFMLLMNTSVAQIIANGLQEQALLRRHEAPLERRISGFVKRAAKLGFEFDATTSQALQRGFDAIEDADASSKRIFSSIQASQAQGFG